MSSSHAALIQEASTSMQTAQHKVHVLPPMQLNDALRQGLGDVVISKLNASSELEATVNVCVDICNCRDVKLWDHVDLLRAMCERMYELAKVKGTDDTEDALFNSLSALVWKYSDDTEEDLVINALSHAGFAKTCMALYDAGGYTRSLVQKADSILINLSNHEGGVTSLIADGLHKHTMKRMKQRNASDTWESGRNTDDAGRAFDIATNLAKWPSIRKELIDEGFVNILADLVKYENYFGFEATEGLAYIVGRSEDAKNTTLLHAKERNVKMIFEVLENSLNGNPYRFNITWSVYGRVLAIRSLAVSDGNKVLMKPAIPLLIRIINEKSQDEKSTSLALASLLELSFNDDCLEIMKNHPGLIESLQNLKSSANFKDLKAVDNLLFALKGSSSQLADGVTAALSQPTKEKSDWVMISYNWKYQSIALEINKRLKEAGINTWIDVEEMNGDSIDSMACAVEGAKAVIVCLAEEYKESGPCRLEANYAFKNRKPIIPVVVASGYNPTGWVGLLVGNSSLVSATSPGEASLAVVKVINEIARRTGLDSASKAAAVAAAASSTTTTTSAPVDGGERVNVGMKSITSQQQQQGRKSMTIFSYQYPSESIQKMKVSDVEKWLIDNKEPKLASVFKKNNIDGNVVAVLYDMANRGDGTVLDVLKEIGVGGILPCLHFLGLNPDHGESQKNEKVCSMSNADVVKWLTENGQAKPASTCKSLGVDGKALNTLYNIFSKRSDGFHLDILGEFGFKTSISRIVFYSLLRDLVLKSSSG